ncbi:MAG TPA: extracellular solute-binding protein, partial [Chloroflexota bacterium]|nr:extracellular solute-binding protein [Chloroflexota bacterium]
RGVAGLVAGGAGAVLVGCGGGTAPDAPPAALSTQPVQVVLSTDWNSTTRMAVMETMKREFMRAHPNVTVEVDYFTSASSSGGSAGTYSEKVIAALVADTPPDVIANFAYAPHVDRMADLTRDAPAAGWKKAEVIFDPHNQEVGGKLYMLSMSSSVSGWAYNKSLFQEAGIADPTDAWTLDEVLDAARKLTRPDKNQWGILAPDALWFGPLELLWAAGAGATSATSAELFSAERKKSRLAEAGGPDAFQWYADLIQRHRFSPSPAEARAQNVAFETGRVGLMPYGVYNSGASAQRIGEQFVWSAMPIPLYPATKKRCCDRNSEGFVIPRTTQRKGTYQAALRYALSFYGDPVQQMVAEQRGTLPIMRKWIESKAYLAPPPLGLEVIPRTLNDKQMIMGDHQQRHKAFPDWSRAVRAELLKALNGENAPKPALQAAMDAGDRVLAAST